MYYDKEGKQIPMLEWADLFEDMKYRKIGDTDVGDYHISTVWIGLNHNIFSETEILIFETMIFCKDEEDYLHQWMERYGTLEEAELGHEIAIELARKKDEIKRL